MRAMYRMMGDLTNFITLIALGITGFGLSLNIGTNGETKSFNSPWTSIRALIYAMLGEIDYEQLINDNTCIDEGDNFEVGWPENGCVNNIRSDQRSFVVTLMLLLWIIVAAILLINFIIAVFNNSFAAVKSEVDMWVKFSRMKVCRANDLKLPTIPAPFQFTIWLMKQFWYIIIEPIVFVVTGKRINEERLICSFGHMKYFYKEDFYTKKQYGSRLRQPFFVEFS